MVPGRKGFTEVKVDEHPRSGTTVEALAKLKPWFIKVSMVVINFVSLIVIESISYLMFRLGPIQNHKR